MSRAIPFSGYRTGTRASGEAGAPRIVRGLRRSWLRIALPTLAAAACAGLFVEFVPQRFTTEAKILLEAGLARPPGEGGGGTIDAQTVASQVQVAQSRDIARQAIRALNLIGNPEFDPAAGEIGALHRALMMLGLAKNPLAGPPEDRILDAYYDRLLVSAVGPSRVLAFEFRAGDPELAAKAANTVAELYIASLAATQSESARSAASALGGSVDALRARLVESEAKIEAFRTRNGFFGADGASQALGSQQIAEISGQLAQARTSRADLVGRVKVLKDMIKEGRAFEVPDVANNVLIRRTVESRITLRAQLALESRTLLPAHPRIKELTAQAADLDAQIKTAAERIARTLENDAKIASARVESLQAAAEGQSTVMGRSSGGEAELRALEREAKLQREQLDAELARYREAAARDGTSANPVEARIIARAPVPDEPSFPKKLPTLAVATALALLLSAAAAIGRSLRPTPPAAESDRASAEDAASARPAADPERLAYPEPLPPGLEPEIAPAEPVLPEAASADAPLPAGEASAAPAGTEETDGAVETVAFIEFIEVVEATVVTADPEPSPAVSSDDHGDEDEVAIVAVEVATLTVQAEDASEDASPVGDADASPAVPAEVLPDASDAAAPFAAETPAAAPRDEAAIEQALVAAAAHWEAMQARAAELAAEPQAAPADAPAVAPEEGAYDFSQLIERLEHGPCQGGRAVLVVETRARSHGDADREETSMVESLARALAYRARTLWVDVNGRLSSEDDPGLSDVVGAEADFLDAIHALPGARLHTIGAGSFETDLLLEEPEGLAIAFNAMVQAYEWVVCRIAAPDAGAHPLIAAVAASMQAVVIVSEAESSEEDLVALYGLAEEAGAGQVLIAQGWAPAAESVLPDESDLALRLTAA